MIAHRFAVSALGFLMAMGNASAGGLSARMDGDRIAAILDQSGNWLLAPPSVMLRDEVTDRVVDPSGPGAPIRLEQRWSTTPAGLVWDLTFTGDGRRVGHEVTIELPVLSRRYEVFTPTERGLISVADSSTLLLTEYGHYGWGDGRYCVLPLVSVLDPRRDRALTIALPPDTHIPHLQIEWQGARALRFRLAHRAMGGGEPARLRLLLYAHPADYRSALDAYSRDFPAYFRPPSPRGQEEGTFYYHHVQAHPDFDEMARQRVRWIWSSFWFPYLGQMLPAEAEWEPYTYARWWRLGERMTDARINGFIDDMHAHGVATYAYFNTTEYGGYGGALGDAEAAERAIAARFGDALLKDAAGNAIPTWEGSKAMNPSPRYSYFGHIEEQVRRHLTRLPGLDGFTIDRLDWSGVIDYGHDDGETMLGDRPVEHLAQPVAEAVQRVCALAHEAGKRVFVNQFYRIEVLRDVDGYCHEYDYPRGMGYLSPYRPASAWHAAAPPQAGLLRFEARLMERLQFALFPQMVAHEFPISQQAPDAAGADLLEVYAPLFDALLQADQVLEPHCVEVSGANDANLFRRPDGCLVAPVTSRTWFLTRDGARAETIRLTLRGRHAGRIRWAYALRADGPPVRADVTHRGDATVISIPSHGTASMVVAGPGAEPPLPEELESVAAARGRVAATAPRGPRAVARPELGGCTSAKLRLTGEHLGPVAPLRVSLGDRHLGSIEGSRAVFDVPLAALGATAPRVVLAAGDEGTWFAVSRAELLVSRGNGRMYCVAEWVPADDTADGEPRQTFLALRWVPPRPCARSTATFAGIDTGTSGRFDGKYGSAGMVTPAAGRQAHAGGCAVEVDGQPFDWQRPSDDPRALQGVASCWFAPDAVTVSVTPEDARPYRLTLYLLDFDRNGRAMDLIVETPFEELDRRQVGVSETESGVYVAWEVTGPVSVRVRKTAGFNAVVSAALTD